MLEEEVTSTQRVAALESILVKVELQEELSQLVSESTMLLESA